MRSATPERTAISYIILSKATPHHQVESFEEGSISLYFGVLLSSQAHETGKGTSLFGEFGTLKLRRTRHNRLLQKPYPVGHMVDAGADYQNIAHNRTLSTIKSAWAATSISLDIVDR